MLTNLTGKFETLITSLIIDKRYEKALENGMKKYQIKQFHVSSLTPQKIVEMYYVISTKFYYNRPAGNSESWHENELRVFIWLVVGYSYLEGRCISEMTQTDWKFFSSIFNHRSPDIFQFQALTTLKRELKCSKWQFQEVSLLESIIKAKSIKNKWNQIAKELFIHSDKRFFRTAKQCRQCWINHLDPKPLKSSWTAAEDYELLEAVKSLGKKWSKVSKRLGGRRTEHMVKNRFKSLYHFELKRENEKQQFSMNEDEIINTMMLKGKRNIEQELKLHEYHNKSQDQFEELLKINKFNSAEALFKCQGQGEQADEEMKEKLSSEVEADFINLQHLEPNQTYTCLTPIARVEHHEMNKENQFSLQDCFNAFFNESCIFRE